MIACVSYSRSTNALFTLSTKVSGFQWHMMDAERIELPVKAQSVVSVNFLSSDPIG